MKQAFLKSAVLVLFLLFAVTSFAAAQTLERGAIHGFVYDASGSAVPGVKVTLSSSATGLKRELTSDANGAYDFEALIPGEYSVVFESPAFNTYTVKQIVVTIGSSLALDAHMKIKTAEQNIVVTADAVGVVDTSTAGISQLLDPKSVQELPFPGRDYRDLATLAPSAQVVPGLRGGLRLGGQQSDYSGLVIDGADTTNNFFGENFGSLETKNLTVPLESVQEFQVVTNGFAPEFGRATGGLLNVVTKSGTNQIHGEAHEYYRGESLTANDALGFKPNINNQNQFGGSVGFPIHKDRQFLFLSTDIQRENGPLATSFCAPGTPAATCAAIAADPGPIIPARAAGGGDQLPASCGGASAVGQHLLKACYGVNTLGDFEKTNTQFQNFFTLLGHYDYQFSPANHFSIRGLGTRNHTNGFTGGRGQNEINAAFDNTENFINQGISGVFALTSVFGRKVNEIRVAVEGETRKRKPNVSFGGTFGQAGPPEINILGVGIFGQRFFLPGNNDNGKLQGQDNFSYSFGKHDVKFGGDVNSFVDRKDIFAGWSASSFTFFDLASFDNPNAGGPNNNVGFVFQGFGLNGSNVFDANKLRPAYQTGIGLYVQDKWQVTPRFTLTYGLRWDGTQNPQPQTPIPGQKVLVGVGAGAHAAPVPQRAPNDFGQWGPRVGFAWNLWAAHPTVVRAAFGLYYAQTPTIFFPQGGGSKNATIFCFFAGCAAPSGFPYVFPNSLPVGVNDLCADATVLIGCAPINYVDPALHNPRAQNLTVGVEHSIAHEWTVSVNYIYMHSTHLKTGGFSTSQWSRNFAIGGTDAFGRALLLNYKGDCPNTIALPPLTEPLDCTLGAATELASFSHGNYHAVTASVNKRFAHHYQFFANYTWSTNKDNASSERDTDTFFGAQDPVNINLDYGRSGLDITHQFKSGVSAELPWGFNWSSNFIAHSGLAYPAYLLADINGDGVFNQAIAGNDAATVQIGSGKPFLLSRYPARQPDFFTWDMRVAKDFKLGERYSVRLSGDFFNLTNRGNLYSNPDNSAFVNATGCAAKPAPFAGNNCAPLTAIPTPGSVNGLGGSYRTLDQISPGSTPFAAQFGVRFQF